MNNEVEEQSTTGKHKIVSEIWAFIRIMNVRLRFIFLMVIVGLVVGHWETLMNYYDRWQRPAQAADMVQSREIEYFCPMHPNIIRAEPGSCPICGMPLSKRAKTAIVKLPEDALAQVQLTPLKVQMGRIGTTPVGYAMLSRETRTVGILEYDETRRAFIASRVKGRIEELMVNYVGQQINKGDPLVSIYSPDLVVAQEELLAALRSLDQQKTASELLRSETEFLVTAAKKKLSLLGITDQQIDQIIRRGTPDTHLVIYSPISGIVTEKNVLTGQYVDEGMRIYTIADLSTVWMQAKIFEDQIAGIEIGTAVEITSTAYPSEVFAGRITFVAYTVDSATRTISARVEIANPDYKLKPGMYANAAIRVPLGQVTEIKEKPESASAPSQSSEEHTIDTRGLSKAYLLLAESYAKDATDIEALNQLINEARALIAKGHGDIVAQMSAIAEQAQKFQDKDLTTQRALFKSLSERVINVLRNSPPSDMTLFTFHCPMADADWAGRTKEVANPYYGKEMLTCGEMTGQITAKVVTEDEKQAVGYYCPIYPSQLFEKPHDCPINKFPIKLVKVEKVLAVPETAVIDTGMRKIVYRETVPGTFDMVEVKIGPRAGEFYPVLSGLKAGDKVATVGAFLVDAENRLNPAASAQYFGASGGHQH